jgi:PAS domain S-box-containing protein
MIALASQPNFPKGGTLDVLLHVLDLLPNPVYIKDRQHRWVEANKAFCEFLGRPREQLLGLSDYDFNPPEQADVFWAMDDVVFNSKGKNVNHEETVNDAGEILWVESQKTISRRMTALNIWSEF